MTSPLIILALLGFVIPMASCATEMNMVAYNATAFSDSSSPGATMFSGYLDKSTNTFFWSFNFTKPGAVGVTALEIRDGKKDMDVLGKELQVFSTAFSGTGTFPGNFSDGINLAVASNATELANHMCMGHIYAVVQTETGSQRAVINYNPKTSGVSDCYAAVGLGGHSMGDMPTDMDGTNMASVRVPSNSAVTVSTALALIIAVMAAAAMV